MAQDELAKAQKDPDLAKLLEPFLPESCDISLDHSSFSPDHFKHVHCLDQSYITWLPTFSHQILNGEGIFMGKVVKR